MDSAKWRSALPRRPDNRALRTWLTERGSLTARLQASCRHFRVRLVAHGLATALDDDPGATRRVPVREVVLECGGEAVIFAHTIMSTATRGPLSLWLARLGNRSLGSLLFAHPGFRRGVIEYRQLDRRHPLYRRAACFANVPPLLWARRSRHRLGTQEVVVTEVFLPAIVQSLQKSNAA